jgi:hypothetical protein
MTAPAASEIAQPALSVDWDIGSWFGLRAIVLPFFEPHLVHVTDGDYALAPAKQADIDEQFFGMSQNAMQMQLLQRFVRQTLSRSAQARLNDTTLSAFAPEPSLTRPQAALRLTAHGSSGEVALTAGVAREHLATPSFDPAFLAYLDAQAQNMVTSAVRDAFLMSRPIQMHYDPYGLVSLDAATGLGPFQVGVELAYLFHRTLLAATTPMPGVDPTTLTMAQAVDAVDYSDFAHAGARIEYAPDTDLIFTVETMVQRAMQAPADPNREYLFLSGGSWVFAAAGFVAGQPWDIGLTLELGAGVLNGPSYMLAPRAQQRVAEGLWVEAGAYFVGGKHGRSDDPAVAIGWLYDDVDQAFVGLRWVP